MKTYNCYFCSELLENHFNEEFWGIYQKYYCSSCCVAYYLSVKELLEIAFNLYPYSVQYYLDCKTVRICKWFNADNGGFWKEIEIIKNIEFIFTPQNVQSKLEIILSMI